jgi:hypothetical protein
VVDIEQLLAETILEGAEWHASIESTNNRALELAADASLKTPYLVGASEQTAGRGRGTNRWWAADGTLMFSVLFDMPSLGIPQSDWPRFSLGTALSVAETIEAFAPQVPVGLKWPNDVWIGARKTCGILIEQSHLAPQRLVVGCLETRPKNFARSRLRWLQSRDSGSVCKKYWSDCCSVGNLISWRNARAIGICVDSGRGFVFSAVTAFASVRRAGTFLVSAMALPMTALCWSRRAVRRDGVTLGRCDCSIEPLLIQSQSIHQDTGNLILVASSAS